MSYQKLEPSKKGGLKKDAQKSYGTFEYSSSAIKQENQATSSKDQKGKGFFSSPFK